MTQDLANSPALAALGLNAAQAELQNVRVQTTLDPNAVVARVDIDKASDAIRQAAAFKFGDSREALAAVEEFVRQSQYNPEDRKTMAMMLGGMLSGAGISATNDAKAFACRQLWIIGTSAEIPVLAVALQDPKLSDIARYALENMDLPEVDSALIAALESPEPLIQIGAINSLAARKSNAALEAIKPLRKSKNKEVAAAAKHAASRLEGKTLP